jgi:hypothetical protein
MVMSSKEGSVLVVYQRARDRWSAASAGACPALAYPEHGQAQADESEWDGMLHGGAGAVARLADAEDLAGVGERDLDAPAGRVAGHQVFHRRCQVGGDQG